MPYKLIKGEFHLYYKITRHVGSRPDGDSMWFKPDHPAYLNDIDGRDAEFNKGGFAQLRFEGIDALELHYTGSNHQKTPECVNARDKLLSMAGFTSVTYAPSDDIDTSVRDSNPKQLTGYILTRNIDPYGRPVAFAFAGGTPRADGSDVWFTPQWMNQSLNARLMTAGEVYPAYYRGLPTDLRNRLTVLADSAWSGNRGLWPVDETISGAKVGKLADLSLRAIWPKLYRRLFKYFKGGSNRRLSGFEDWLREDPDRDDEVWIISEGESGNMHDVIDVKGNTIWMCYWPEDIVVNPG